MNPWFYQLAQELPGMTTRADLTAAREDIEDHYDLFDEVDQATADELIEMLNRRLAALSADN